MDIGKEGFSALNFSIFILLLFSLLPLQCCSQVHDITLSRPLAEGQTIVSPGNIFELGFFSPNNSAANKYVGIWYQNILPRKVVWVANREKPLAVADTVASLRISSNGTLELVDGKQNSVWSNNVSVPSNSSAAALLLDDGNFVVKVNAGAADHLWESFDYPSDTLLPSMLLGFDSKSGKRNFLSAWKSESDPSTGIFLAGLTLEVPSQLVVWINDQLSTGEAGHGINQVHRRTRNG
ncbi:hypothetical protein Prudu_010883 [Prunus dulcis]|uniref:Bulb-type lectin domain-containing protein n=1 Tax=Prunus dulcis TaxID=3755 RepID=A0A4Y1R9V1_PRUDU|nr:hypothetical protein Prudu_010883 [Prunus dulcis]